MDVDLNTISPLSFTEWLRYQDALNPQNKETAYFDYLYNWYTTQNDKKGIVQQSVKEQYIQLLKDLSFLFGSQETDNPFLKDLDYNNPEELIYTIPFFAKKLKQVAFVLQKKRESLKEAKLKYNLIGSNDGFEKLVYEYVLKGFTNTENGLTQVPASPLINYFPDLSAVKDNFFIEVEELHDSNSYHDSDPRVPISNYLDVNAISDLTPFTDLTRAELDALLKTRFNYTVADNPLSRAFNVFFANLPNMSGADATFYSDYLRNSIDLSQKYLGEPVYGLTAVRLKDVNMADAMTNLNFTAGNNWFYFPSGNKVYTENIFNNVFEPIQLNNSNLVNSGATGGDNYTNSDLIFTDKNGVVEGAWLQGPHIEKNQQNMVVNIPGGDTRDFIYPFPGININSKSLEFENYSSDDTNNESLQLLPVSTRQKIFESYFNSTLPDISANPIYLNQTDLIKIGAHAAEFSDAADNVVKIQKINTSATYSESIYNPIDQAYCYKFQRTDLPIKSGITQIHWPLHIYGETENSPITITKDFCNPVVLSNINPLYDMVGAVAGLDISTSDVIYKFNSRNGEPIEAAWLGADDVLNLDIQNNSIPVYDKPAINCSYPISGPVQSSLSFRAAPLDKISFVWMDQDTPADEVFKYVEHAPSCQYGKSMPHDFYVDQDYQNLTPINQLDAWKKCTCKAIHYSPIGHAGTFVGEFNGMADYLFADPQGLGADFSLNSWKDTRGLDVNNSPQFSFYKITNGDSNVGYGNGYWKTGDGSAMVLKTGRRYTYYRTSLRTDSGSNKTPYFVINRPYYNVTGIYNSSEVYDLVLAIDLSRSQSNYIDSVKTITKNLVYKILNNKINNAKISVIVFGTNASRMSWLTKDFATLGLFIDQLDVYKTPDSYQSNIADALILANNILTNSIFENSDQYVYQVSDLCKNLHFAIVENTIGIQNSINVPQNGKKKILIFSDGVENISAGLAYPYAEFLKGSNVEIYGINVGDLATSNDLMKLMSNSLNYYFDLQSFLNGGDGDLGSFIEYISRKIGGSYSIRPMWYKAIRDEFGNWNSTRELSDMVLNPGDYLAYVHRDGSSYVSEQNINYSFNTPSVSFTVNIKINGWDYETNTYSTENIGTKYGGKPFWAKVYTSPDSDNNWYKGTMAYGGHIRFFDGYVPIHQPQVSTLTFNTGDNIQYVRKASKDITWTQNLTYSYFISSYEWKQLTLSEDYSNLYDFLRNGKIDGVVNDTKSTSYMTLEQYSFFKPAYYNYYARKNFSYTENLYNIGRCLNSFVVYNTGVMIDPIAPAANLINTFYPTVATIAFPSTTVSDKQVGDYLLPEKLGTPYYRGKGYTIEIDNNSLDKVDQGGAERTFLDINKYGPRNRGLTKKDQLSPTKITQISNRWMSESFSSADKGGVIVNTLENQKLTPYQTTYEFYNKNHYGLARQSDIFEFWTPAIPGTWNDPISYPLDFKKQLPPSEYTSRKNRLLVDKGDMQNWRVDLYSNEYGLYKQFSPLDIDGLFMWFSTDRGLINKISQDPFGFNTLANPQNYDEVEAWVDQSGKNNNLYSQNGSNPYVFYDNTANNRPALAFDGTCNLINDFNVDTTDCTMFIVGKYAQANNSFAYDNYQVLAGFGRIDDVGTEYVDYGSLVFSQKYGDFTFVFGDNTGTYVPSITGSPLYQIELSDYYTGPTYPPKKQYYLFETSFNSPSARTFINGEMIADNMGVVYQNDYLPYPTKLVSTGGFSVGSYISNQLYTQCYVLEILYYNKQLSDDEASKIRDYLNSKYNLY